MTAKAKCDFRRDKKSRSVYPTASDAELAQCFREGSADWDKGGPCPYPTGERRWWWQQGCIFGENAFWRQRRVPAAVRGAA
jgi:hypothetical protein